MPEFLVGPDEGWGDESAWHAYLSFHDDEFTPRVIDAKTPQAAARAYGKSQGVPEQGVVVQALHDPIPFTLTETQSVSVKPR